MIKALLEYNGKTTEYTFPESEAKLMAKLREDGAVNNFDDIDTLYVKEIIEPIELKVMEGLYINPDELNYLSKRLETLCNSEVDQFFTALELRPLSEPQDLINLSFNLNKFTLIKDVSSFSRVGYMYMLNKNGCAEPFESENERYYNIGKALLESGKGTFTDRGLMFISPGMMEDVYKGDVFPALNVRDDCIAEVIVSYGYAKEFLFLPEEPEAIRKAIKRLGAPSADSCELDIPSANLWPYELNNALQHISEKYDIYEVNDLLNELESYKVDYNKLSLALEYFDVQEPENIVSIAKHLNSFNYIKGIETEAGLAEYYFENIAYSDNGDFPSLTDLGIHIIESQKGNFINDVYVYFGDTNEYEEIRNVLKSEDNEMALGSMY